MEQATKEMTTKERLVAMVFKMGVGEEDAKAIVEAAIPRMNSDNYRVTFDRPASEYPDAMYATWWITALKPAEAPQGHVLPHGHRTWQLAEADAVIHLALVEQEARAFFNHPKP